MPILPTPWPHVFLEDSVDLRWEWIYHTSSNTTFVVSYSYMPVATKKRRILKYNTTTLALISATELDCLDITYNTTDNHFYTITPTHVRKYDNTLSEVASYAPTAISMDGFIPSNIASFGTGVYIGGVAGSPTVESYLLKVNTALTSEPWIELIDELDGAVPNRVTAASGGDLFLGALDPTGEIWLIRFNPSTGAQGRWATPLDYTTHTPGTIVWDGANKLLLHGQDQSTTPSTASGILVLWDIPSNAFVSTRQVDDIYLRHYYGYPSNARIWTDRRNTSDSNRRSRLQELDVSSLSDMRLFDHLTWDFPAVNPPGAAPYHSAYKDGMALDTVNNKLWIARFYDGVLVNDGFPGVYVCTVEPTYDPPPTDPPPPDPEDPPPDPCTITIYSIQEPDLPPLPNLMDIGGLGPEPDLQQVTTELWTYLRDLNSAMFGTGTDPDTVSVFLSMFRRWSALSLSNTQQPEIPPDPLPPEGVAAFGLGALNLVEWSFSRDPSIKGYEVQHSTVSDFSVDVQFVRLNGRQWIDPDVAAGITKYYRVRSLRDNNRISAWSSTVSATTQGIDVSSVSPVVAGNGLSGGGGLPLSVNAGPGIIIVNDAVQAHVDNIHIGLTTGQISVINRHALSGTANQVILSASGANALIGEVDITLSLPQNIHTGATPTFADMTLSSLTANRLVRTGAASSLDSVAALTDWIAGTVNRVTVADDGDGTVTLSVPQDIHTGASPQFVGLNLSGLTASQLVVTDGSKNLASLARGDLAGTANQVNLSASGTGVLAGTSITLSLPQNIHTGASPTFTGLTLSGLTQGSVLFAGVGGLVSEDNPGLVYTPDTSLVFSSTTGAIGFTTESQVNADNAIDLYSNDTSGVTLRLRKARGTISSPAIVANGDTVGTILFGARGGTTFRNPTGIAGIIVGTPSGSTVPVDLTFGAGDGTTSFSPGNSVERMRITATGFVGIDTTLPTKTLSFGGNTAKTLWMERHTTANTAGNSLTVQAGGATSGATDKNGGSLILVPGINTGTGRSTVNIKGRTVATTTGTGNGIEIDRQIVGAFKALTNNTVIALVNCTLANNTVVAGTLRYAVEVFDGTDVQIEEGYISYHATNKAGAIANNTVIKYGNQQAITAGTLTVTFTITAANPAVVSVNANSSLTPSAGHPHITYTLDNLTQQAVAIQ